MQDYNQFKSRAGNRILGAPSPPVLCKLSKIMLEENRRLHGRSSDLSFSTQRSILLAIKEAGGLELFNTTTLCAADPDTFGPLASATRRAVQNKVDTYKRFPDRYHNQQLEILGEIFERREQPFSASSKQKATPSPIPSSPPVPTNLFASMSLDPFGRVAHDQVHDVNLLDAWDNSGCFIYKTKGVKVGDDDGNNVVSTDVLTIVIECADARFFEVENFEPYKLTQTSRDEFVLERPRAGFDTLFPSTEESVEFVVGATEQEQDEYKVARNRLIKPGGSDIQDFSFLRSKTLFRCGGVGDLDFALIDPEKRKGEVDYEFIGDFASAQLGLRWRIAFKETERFIKQRKQNRNKVKEKFEAYKSRGRPDGPTSGGKFMY